MNAEWTSASSRPPRPILPAMLRGLAGCCPACGKRGLFRKFLKVSDHCPNCNEALHHQRADDAPAYFVIVIVGHLVVPLALSVELALAPAYWVHMLLWGPMTVGLSLGLLSPIKGSIVGLQWANYMHGFDPDGPGMEPDALPPARPAS